MSDGAKIRLVKYGAAAVFTGLMVWIYISLRPFPGETLAETFKVLCDALTIPGALLLAVGGLVWASNEGALDGLGYVFDVTWKALIPGKRGSVMKYAEYVQSKREKPVIGYGFLLISGAVVMVAALVFLVLFYTQYKG